MRNHPGLRLGKTAIALNIAQNVAMHSSDEDRTAVAFFSLEMSKEQLVIRMLCSEARVDGNKVKTGFVSKSDWSDLTLAAADGSRLGDERVLGRDGGVVADRVVGSGQRASGPGRPDKQQGQQAAQGESHARLVVVR